MRGVIAKRLRRQAIQDVSDRINVDPKTVRDYYTASVASRARELKNRHKRTLAIHGIGQLKPLCGKRITWTMSENGRTGERIVIGVGRWGR